MTRFLVLLLCISFASAQDNAQPKGTHDPANNLFDSVEPMLPTPNVYRTGSGAPGPEYWQNTADYVIDVQLDDATQMVTGKEVITYVNNSPDPLSYLFVQLEQNYLDPHGISWQTEDKSFKDMDTEEWNSWNYRNNFPGGYKIKKVADAGGKPLKYTIKHTNLRVDLPSALSANGGRVSITIEWEHKRTDNRIGMRTGYEQFEDGNRLYELAHWFPRMAVYNDAEGWQNQHFLGRGEFALPFGNYKVNITLPEDFVVAATGELKNSKNVMTSTQQDRWKKAQSEYIQPVIIITEEEAVENAKSRATDTKTWKYEANNVRDFAWAASRKFIWDAMALDMNGRNVMCMSYYPKEGNPLWEKYSTKVVAHTVKTYSKYTVDFPWPTMISVNGPVGGMEYPMITFNGPRPETDGTYSEGTKKGLISVIIHEVGHNFFPMIINSDERDHTWQDEGFNVYIQSLTEQEWQLGYEARRGPSYTITGFMAGGSKEVIYMHSDRIGEFGNTQYAKVAAGLTILRETIVGREVFDFAFKTYCQRWALKHPRPADFFRSIEDASGVDLDWFWRGWWMSSDPVDINLAKVTQFRMDRMDPEENLSYAREQHDTQKKTYIGYQRNQKEIKDTYAERDTSVLDFYDKWDDYAPNKYHDRVYRNFRNSLSEEDEQYIDQNKYYYQLDFVNEGGMMMPLTIKLNYEDGTTEDLHIPVEIWRQNNYEVHKALILDKALSSVELDPYLETADVDMSDNVFPRKIEIETFDIFKKREGEGVNEMQLEKIMRGWD